MATQGFVVFCAIYSTFLQRAYDQLIHDVAIQNLPVIFCLDRAGLVGEDGATHHGVFDIAYSRAIPNIIIAAPRNEAELRNLLYTAQLDLNSPLIIRYPRGRGVLKEWKFPFEKVIFGKGELLKQGDEVAVLTIGNMAANVEQAIERTKDSSKFAHYDMRYVKPLDEKLLQEIFKKFSRILTVEDGVKKGGFGSAILEYAASLGYKGDIEILGIPDKFIEQGSVEQLQEISGICVEGLRQKFKSMI
jgi:1-deoxy-D-xylulose-5-phosphate synthase